jgi:hypothetical protein
MLHEIPENSNCAHYSPRAPLKSSVSRTSKAVNASSAKRPLTPTTSKTWGPRRLAVPPLPKGKGRGFDFIPLQGERGDRKAAGEGSLHCNTVNSCFFDKTFSLPAPSCATGVPPVPEHGQDGRGTSLVAASPLALRKGCAFPLNLVRAARRFRATGILPMLGHGQDGHGTRESRAQVKMVFVRRSPYGRMRFPGRHPSLPWLIESSQAAS